LSPRVGIVVPTLGKRPDYLKQCLTSIRCAGEAHILLVAPKEFSPDELKSLSLIDASVEDKGEGLAAAINWGIESLPVDIEYVTWLGDDDLLTKGSLKRSLEVLDSSKDAVMAFGACDYVDGEGRVIWNNRSGQWAVPLLSFGPDLIPQPGALFSRAAFEKVGGLRTDLGWAFDFDLFLKFSKIGKIKYLDQKLAQFRWHPESLSVEHRKKSVAEASQVRVSHLPLLLRPISFLWEYPVRQATLIAGNQVTARAKSKARSK
jgi:GT2 family glycosyltransferase